MRSIDSAIFEFLYNLTGNFLVDGIFVFFAGYLIYILTFVFLLYAVRIKNWRERVRIFSTAVLATILSRGIITPVIRFFANRERPFSEMNIDSLVEQVSDGAFPSGHMTFIVPIMFALFYINKRAGTWGLVGAVLIGIARIGAGVHWPSDVVGGFLIGLISYAIVELSLKRKLSKKERTALTENTKE